VADALRRHRAARTIGTFLRRSVVVRRRNHGIRDGGGDGSGKGHADKGSNTTKWVVGGNDKKRRRTAKTPPPVKGGNSNSSGQDATTDADADKDGSSNGTGGGSDKGAGGGSKPPMEKKRAVGGTLGIAQRHWAWSSLLAPSLRVRRATARLLLDGVVPPSRAPIASLARGPCFATLEQLVATLLDLANQDLLLHISPTAAAAAASCNISISMSDDTAHNGRRGYGMDTGGDPSLQLLGLLSHLVTEEPVLRMASERSVLDQMSAGVAAVAAASGSSSISTTTCSSGTTTWLGTSSLVSPSELIESDRSIESFVASGGLRWAAASLLRVVVELTTRTAAAPAAAAAAAVQGDDGDDDMGLLTEASSSSFLPSSPRPCGGSDETELEMLQARLVALVDLLYRIVLYAGLTHCDYWKVESQSPASTNTTTGAGAGAVNTPTSPSPSLATASAASIAMENTQNSKLLDKFRQKRRQDALTSVHDLLWSSTVPALSVTSGTTSGTGDAAAKLSPLACIVASHELLKTGSSNGGSPYLSGRNRGLDRALACLSRIVDISSTVSVELPTAGGASASAASASSRRGGSSAAGRSGGASTADRALGGFRDRASISGGRMPRRRRLASRRSRSSAAAAHRAYSNSLASSLLGLASPGGAESDPFAAAGFGSPDSSSSAAVARSVSAAMSALDRARARESAGGALPMALDDIDESDDDDDRSNHGSSRQQRSRQQHGHGDGNGDSDDDDDDDHGDCDEEDPDAAYDRETDMEGEEGKDDDEDEDDEEIPSDDEDIVPARAQPVDMDIDEPFEDSLLMVDDDGPAGLHDSQADAAANRAMAAAAAAIESPASSSRLRITSPGAPVGTAAASATAKKPSAATKGRRRSAYLKTGMSLLEAQHASSHQSQRLCTIVSSSLASSIVLLPPILTAAAEQSLLKSMCDIIRPQKKPVNLKMFLRRAPTQEEFFRGNLTRNPVSLAHLAKDRAGTSSAAAADGAGQGSGSNEPTVRDLRDHIAKDLQVSREKSVYTPRNLPSTMVSLSSFVTLTSFLFLLLVHSSTSADV